MHDAGVAQLVEQPPFKRQCAGSSPAPRMRSPKLRGELSEMEAMLALMRAGYTVRTAPFTDCVRHDCVLDDVGRFLRVQIKTGRLSRDGRAILSQTASKNWHRGTTQDYVGDADLFAVFCPANGHTYLVPVNEVGVAGAVLRLAPTRNGQSAGVRMAAAYEVVPASRVEPGPLQQPNGPPRTPGSFEGQITVPDGFFDPPPDDELRAWGQA